MEGQDAETGADWAWITARHWQLDTIDAHAPLKNSQLSLDFVEPGLLGGGSGCNRYNASFALGPDSGIQISQILSTRMYCAHPQGVMQQEARYLHLLQSVDTYDAQPDRLDFYADDTLVLSFMPVDD